MMRLLPLFTFLLSMTVSLTVFSADEHYTSRIEGSDISPSGSILGTYGLYDDKYYDMSMNPMWGGIFTNYGVRNYVELGINPGVLQQTDYAVDVTVDVRYHVWNGLTHGTIKQNP